MTAWTAAHSAALTARPVLGINFHHVPVDHRPQVRRQLQAAAAQGDALQLDQLAGPEERDGRAGPVDDSSRPQLFVAFYDGYRETSLFGAEICAELGLRAYFFPVFSSPDPARGTLTDDDLAQIATVHEVGFHTSSHLRAADVTADNLETEVLQPLARIRTATGTQPRVGAWRGGARFDQDTLGDRTIRAEGVRWLVSNWSVEAI